MFADDHGGQMPDALEELFPVYLSGPMNRILHPGTEHSSLKPFQWLYTPRPKLEVGDPKDIVLASSNLYDPKEGSKKVRIVIRYDGSGEAIDDREYQRKIAAQLGK